MAAITLEELLKEVGLCPEKLNESTSDDHLRKIALFLTSWQTVASHLDLSENDISDVEREGKNEQDLRLNTLQRWKGKFGFKATYMKLVEVLLSLAMADVAEKVCRLLKENEATPPKSGILQHQLRERLSCLDGNFEIQHPPFQQWQFELHATWFDTGQSGRLPPGEGGITIGYWDNYPTLKPFAKQAKLTGIQLGAGAYGSVEQVKIEGETFAAKRFRVGKSMNPDKFHKKFLSEFRVLFSLNHHNIVQYQGVCCLPDSNFPALLMEQLQTSLHAYLLNPSCANLSLNAKVSILHDIAKGLAYLHNHKPAVIHRDLTAKNVLLSSKSVAKISDFGNSRIVDIDPSSSSELQNTTHVPGTSVYMPPEASTAPAKFNRKLDIFSFGHLALFTATQVFPHFLLPATFIDDDGELCARTEVGRRQPYIDLLVQQLHENHNLVTLIKQCLHNNHRMRPTADNIADHQLMQHHTSQQHNFAFMSDEEAQKIVDQALKLGSIEQRNTVAVVVGIARSGKTSLISRLFHEKPPDRYTSTGVAEQSLRGLMHHIATRKSWERLSLEEILKIFASFIPAGLPEADVASLAKNFTEEEEPEPTQVPSGKEPSPSQPGTPEPEPSGTPLSPSPSQKSYASQTMTRLVQTVQDPQKAVLIELLHVIDTGGQPEFMEIMPSLIHNFNLTLLVLNLDQPLDEEPQFVFYENDTPFKRPHPSIRTNRQVINQLAHTLQTKQPTRKGRQHSKVSVIGTHRDCVEKKGKLPETLAAMNEEVDSIFKEDELMNEIVPVNLKEPDDKDEKVLEKLRQRISKSMGVKTEIPFSFFMFEHEAIRYAEQKKDRKGMVLSFEECVQVGARLKMSPEVVQAALIYFHHHNIFLYFQRVLPNLVFLAPEVPLDFVNTVVAFSCRVKSGALPGLQAKYVRFCNEGIVTEAMLCDESLRLSDHFVPGIYEPQDAINLFLHIYTIAPLRNEERLGKNQQPSTHSCKSGQGKRQYLMMTLLDDKPEKDIQKYLPSPSKVAPLVVHFSSGCVPIGCFSNTISCLISTYNWKVCRTEEGKPECLAHNIVTLSDPTLPVTITMVNYMQHLEIHVSMAEVEEDFNEICLCLRKTVFAAMETVFKVMRFEDIQVEPAFLCPCRSKPSHAAVVCHFLFGGSYTVCSKRGVSVGVLQKEQQFWFQDGKEDEGSSCHAVTKHRKASAGEESWKDQADTKTVQRPTVTLQQLIRCRTKSGSLLDQIGTRYWDVGVLLLNDDTGVITQAIVDQYHEDASINREILERWIQGQGMPVKWATLIEVLKDIGLRELAREMEEKFYTEEVN